MKLEKDIVKNLNQFKRVVAEIEASGVTDEEEVAEILSCEHQYLFRELTEKEKEDAMREFMHSTIETAMAQMNRESIAEKGHPEYVGHRIDGVKYWKRYDALSSEEIAELKQQGVIL